MINPCDKNIKWNDRANDEMSLLTMIDTWLIEDDVSIPLIKYKPCDMATLKKTDTFCLGTIYQDHQSLLLDIVEIFFPTLLFVPSEINKEGTNEFFLFIVISAIHDIVWYNNVEDSRPRGYEKTLKEINKARYYLYSIADSSIIDNAIQFPRHRNETIERLDNFFIDHKRKQQGEKIISKIKNYFGIKKVTSTKKKKMIEANRRIQEKIKKDHNITDEELHNIPFVGQLQTKI